MDVDKIKSIIDFFNSFKGVNEVSLAIYILDVAIIFIISIIKELNDMKNKKANKNGEFKFFEAILESIIGGIIGTLILFLFGTGAIFLAPPIGAIVGIYLYQKYIDSNDSSSPSNSNNININISTHDDKEDKGNRPDINQEFNSSFENSILGDDRLERIRKKGGYDILDVLLLYKYISLNQYDKLIQASILESPEEMVKQLLTMPTLTDEELKEARAIVNLIRLKGRIVSKDEAITYIRKFEALKKNSTKGDSI